MTQLTIFDITAGKHGGNPESRTANLKACPNKQHWHGEIIRYLAFVRRDATCAELSQHFGVAMHRISGRCSELKALGLIVPTEERRNGGRVLILKEKTQ